MISYFKTEGLASGGKSKQMNKTIRKMKLVYLEESFRERLGCVRGDINLQEHVLFVSNRPLQIPDIKREFYNMISSSSKADTLGPIPMLKWQDSWQATVQRKRQIIGASNKVEVGGPIPDGTKRDPPKPTDVEPVFYHCMPLNWYMLVLREVPCVAGIDCSPGEGLNAVAHIKNRKPYTGICFTQHHADALHEHLVHEVFKMSLTEGDDGFDPALAATIAKARKPVAPAGSKPKGTKPKKADADKGKDGDNDEGKAGNKDGNKDGKSGEEKNPGKKDGTKNTGKKKSKKELMDMLSKLRESKGEDKDDEEEADEEEEDSQDDK